MDNHYSHEENEVSLPHYADLFHKIEQEFHLHFSAKEISEAHDIDHVIHTTVHALHAKGQRPWSSILVASIFFFFLLSLHYVAEVGWSAILKRVFMAIGSFLPYVGVAFS